MYLYIQLYEHLRKPKDFTKQLPKCCNSLKITIKNNFWGVLEIPLPVGSKTPQKLFLLLLLFVRQLQHVGMCLLKSVGFHQVFIGLYVKLYGNLMKTHIDFNKNIPKRCNFLKITIKPNFWGVLEIPGPLGSKTPHKLCVYVFFETVAAFW